MGVSSTANKIEHLQSATEGSNAKQKNISSTTRNMLMKSRAEGATNIPPEQRHYLAVTFTSTNQMRYVYFSKLHSIGECLKYIASNMTLLAFNTNHPPASQALTCQTGITPRQQ